MPIRPENVARYPDDWAAIAIATKERAGWRCEGSPAYPDCRRAHGSIGYWTDGGRWWQEIHRVTENGPRAVEAMRAASFEYDGVEIRRVVLTVGHLDHQPENCDPANLRAWCQRCHLTYDAKHHAQTAARTRREGKAAADLFEEASDG